MAGPYPLEQWYDTPDARRIQADSFVAANNYSSPTFFPHAAAGIRGGQQAASSLSTPQPRNMRALQTQQQQNGLRQRAMEALKASHDAAFAAEQAREQQILTGYKERRQRAMDSLGGALTTALMPVNDRYDKIAASTRSTFNQTGLGGTTALPTTLLGIERERGRNVGQLVNSMGPSIASMEAQLSGDELDFLRSIETEYPDEKAMYDLALLEGAGDQQGMDIRGAGAGIGGVMPGGPGVTLVPAGQAPPRQRRSRRDREEEADGGSASLEAYYDPRVYDQMIKDSNRRKSLQKTRDAKAGAKPKAVPPIPSVPIPSVAVRAPMPARPLLTVPDVYMQANIGPSALANKQPWITNYGLDPRTGKRR